MYDLLKLKNLFGVLVVVIRYYGGVKLGAGGLVRSYRQASMLTINQILNKGIQDDKNNSRKNNSLMLKAAYQGMEFPKYVGTKKFHLTNNLQTNESYVYIEKENINLDDLKSWFINFAKDLDMDYQIDLNSFAQKFKKEELIRFFILNAYFARTELFKKTIKEKENKINNLYLLVNENDIHTKELINKVELIAKAIAKVRNLQIMPENFLNSEQLASEITNDFSGIKNLEIQVLTKKEIQDLNMGLLLSVNKGSTHEPRVVIVKYFW